MKFSWLQLMAFVVAVVFLLTPCLLASVSALDGDDATSILNETTFYDPNRTADSCSTATTDPTDPSPTNGDARQIAFFYFTSKGLTDVQSAAIIGNLMQESGVNPRSNQDGGPGMGIAQWSNPGRWNQLQAFAQLPENKGKDIFSLGLQLDFMWRELQGQAPASNYSGALTNLKQQTDIADATGWFMGTAAVDTPDAATVTFMEKYGKVSGYENPGTPVLGNRIDYAKKALADFGGTASGTVSGTGAGCGSAASVDCNNTAAAGATLSQVRQDVVCIAREELALWDKGTLKPGPQNDFYKYSNGINDEWCAFFVSWVYAKANYPVPGGSIGAVLALQDLGKQDGKFTYHSSTGYTPIPGDMAIHIYSEGHHVNLVVSVNANNKSMVAIGGNQDGDTRANNSSKVTQISYNSFTADDIVGYVSPKE